MTYLGKIRCFKNIKISVESIQKNRTVILIDLGDDVFHLYFTYNHKVNLNENLAGLMGISAVINYSLFTENIVMDFPTSKTDREMIEEMVRINNREVFINRLCRRRYEFFRAEYLPDDKEITTENSMGDVRLIFTKEFDDEYEVKRPVSSAIMSSGGKESLLTYGLMREMTVSPVAYFFNESGGHWKAAKHSYDVIKEQATAAKVWSNVDRFYNYMNHRMPILDPDVSFKWADDYPVQLFLFPVYLFSMIPSFDVLGIKDIAMGNELDDPLETGPYRGMNHYFGVYDQSLDFQNRFSRYMDEKGFGVHLWSALYNIYGTVVENILVNRYPDLYELQRSCHSCHYVNGDVYPCGKCSKCLGVRLFIEYAGGSPEKIHYPPVTDLEHLVKMEKMKLDPDELKFLMDGLISGKYEENTQITGIHRLMNEKAAFGNVPEIYRERLSSIVKQYTDAEWEEVDKSWKKVRNSTSRRLSTF